MTRARLRPAYTPAELAELYATPHDHRAWRDHHLRVAVTVEVARWMAADTALEAAADLACGNAAVLRAVQLDDPRLKTLHLGDLAPGYDYTGPIEDTVTQIPNVDLFVCSETLEHLDDPAKILEAIRSKTRSLVLSTPVDAWDDGNPEHYWAWSRSDVEAMLTSAGFETVVYTALDLRPAGYPYQFGIWGTR